MLIILCAVGEGEPSDMTSRSPPSNTPAAPLSDQAADLLGPPKSSPVPPSTPAHDDWPASAGGGSPTTATPLVGTSCALSDDDDPARLTSVVATDEDVKTTASATGANSLRLQQTHSAHGKKRRASGDSHEVPIYTPASTIFSTYYSTSRSYETQSTSCK